MTDIFLLYKGPFGKFPLIAGFSWTLIGAIHNSGRALAGKCGGGGLGPEKGGGCCTVDNVGESKPPLRIFKRSTKILKAFQVDDEANASCL